MAKFASAKINLAKITLLHVLRNLKHSLDILQESLDITVVITKLKTVLGLPVFWTFCNAFDPFCSMLLKDYGII